MASLDADADGGEPTNGNGVADASGLPTGVPHLLGVAVGLMAGAVNTPATAANTINRVAVLTTTLPSSGAGRSGKASG